MPVHKLMKSAQFLYRFFARSQVEMIGVPKDNLGAKLGEFVGQHGFYCGFGANRHKNRGFNGTVSRLQMTRPSISLCGRDCESAEGGLGGVGSWRSIACRGARGASDLRVIKFVHRGSLLTRI